MISVVNVTDIVNGMKESMRLNVEHIKETVPKGPDRTVSIQRIKNFFQAGIDQIESAKTDEEFVTLMLTVCINFTVLQLDHDSIMILLKSEGIEIDDIIAKRTAQKTQKTSS